MSRQAAETGELPGLTIDSGRPGWLDPGALGGAVQRMQLAGATAVLVEHDGRVIGAIAVRDELRPEAGEVVAQLRRDGYHVAMLTGDNLITAGALAKDAGIDDVHADLRPQDKARLIRQLRTARPTAMVGDGVNDAPALAADLRHLPRTFRHARRARGIMLQNVGLSLAIVAALMPLALFGVLGLAAVVLVHEVAEIVVIANGVRAGRTKPLAIEPIDRSASLPRTGTAGASS